MTDKKIYALDTNVLIHDPNAVFNFEEHDVMIPMVVLEELDKLKVGSKSISADCRHAVRTIDGIIGAATPKEVNEGVEIKFLSDDDKPRKHNGLLGKLSILMPQAESGQLDEKINDNKIINDLISLKQRYPNRTIILVTKDINMRLKARGCGLDAEDYSSDQLITDIDRLAKGYHRVEGAFWERLETLEPQQLNGGSIHVVSRAVLSEILFEPFCVNQFVLDEKEFVGRFLKVDEDTVTMELLTTGTLMRRKAWGLSPRDLYQGMCMHLLLDPEIDLVAINGAAGSGKTILALACALEQTLENKIYKRIIATRSTQSLDEDIGFLPGTETEKMTPWLGAFTDNLEALHAEDLDPNGSEEYVDSNVPLHFKSLNFVRGRSFQHTYLIVDESQNLTPHQMKTIITRAGEGTKVICLGNLAQIDTPYLGATSSGLTYMSERFKGFAHGSSITLKGVARSRLAAYAETHL